MTTPMFQFSKKAQADAEEVQDLTEEQLLQVSGGVAKKHTSKTTTHTNKGKHLAKGHTKTHGTGKATGHH